MLWVFIPYSRRTHSSRQIYAGLISHRFALNFVHQPCLSLHEIMWGIQFLSFFWFCFRHVYVRWSGLYLFGSVNLKVFQDGSRLIVKFQNTWLEKGPYQNFKTLIFWWFFLLKSFQKHKVSVSFVTSLKACCDIWFNLNFICHYCQPCHSDWREIRTCQFGCTS